MICLRRRNKVQWPEAIEAALFVGFLEASAQAPLMLSQDGNSFIVSWAEQNI
jgi:hypothetical protein